MHVLARHGRHPAVGELMGYDRVRSRWRLGNLLTLLNLTLLAFMVFRRQA